MTMREAVRATIQGRVQGVGFRYSARSEALRVGVCGFVRNEPDGSVYVEAEGEMTAVEAMLVWLRKGPPGSNVTRVDVRRTSPKEFRTFTVES